MSARRSDKGTTAAPRVDDCDWAAITAEFDAHGCATVGPLLTLAECKELRQAYDLESLYRKRVVMAHHSFGRGEYKYFDNLLPAAVAELRAASPTRLDETGFLRSPEILVPQRATGRINAAIPQLGPIAKCSLDWPGSSESLPLDRLP